MSSKKRIPKIKLGPGMAIAVKNEKLNVNFIIFHQMMGKTMAQVVVSQSYLHESEKLLFQSLCN